MILFVTSQHPGTRDERCNGKYLHKKISPLLISQTFFKNPPKTKQPSPNHPHKTLKNSPPFKPGEFFAKTLPQTQPGRSSHTWSWYPFWWPFSTSAVWASFDTTAAWAVKISIQGGPPYDRYSNGVIGPLEMALWMGNWGCNPTCNPTYNW